jgi:NADP-dependent 3-hydroxy acid dehydrogenase YdfG
VTRTVVVTGAGHGLGAGIDRAAHDAGWAVGVLDRDAAAAASVAADLGGSALALVADTTVEAEVEDALDAFIRADGTLGRQVCRDDDVVDSLHDSVLRVLLTHMMADPKTITPSLELLLVGRNLERIADLATNIGEDAVYLAEGKQIKHHHEEDHFIEARLKPVANN